MEKKPAVYLLYGENEVGIETAIAKMIGKLGEESTATMNTVRKEGRVNMGELKRIVSAVPFLSRRRLVVLKETAGLLTGKNQRADFLELLEGVPRSTGLVLVEKPRTNRKPKDRNKHVEWLFQWIAEHPGRAYRKDYPLLKGSALAGWVRDYAREQGGAIEPQAARHLLNLVGDDMRRASTEVDKLLAFVNGARPVEIDDVELLTAPVRQGDVFAMVDAIGGKDGRRALGLLHELLAERDAMPLFVMVVRQFRLLIQVKEMVAENAAPGQISRALKVHAFVVNKLTRQSRNFDMAALESTFARLVAIDDAIKSGRVEPDIALDMFVAEVVTN